MSDITDKKSWYDGKLYADMCKYFGGNTLDEITTKLIEPDTSIIDIGCGPGMLIFHLLRNTTPTDKSL
jgi:ubiquinone/menaquinone biosynthesis C-methylase UbiE